MGKITVREPGTVFIDPNSFSGDASMSGIQSVQAIESKSALTSLRTLSV